MIQVVVIQVVGIQVVGIQVVGIQVVGIQVFAIHEVFPLASSDRPKPKFEPKPKVPKFRFV